MHDSGRYKCAGGLLSREMLCDDGQKWSNLGLMSEQESVQCLLDFSRESAAVLVHGFSKATDCSDRISGFSDFKMESPRSSSEQEEHAGGSEAPANRGSKTEGRPRAVCSFCGKEFSHLGDHNKHRRRHTGERPYGCDLCPLRFAHASNLARHRRLHSGEKPFACAGCGRGFARKDKLNAHVARRRCGASSPPKTDGGTRTTGAPED